MKKPNNFENTKASGEYTPISVGGHHMVIKKVEEMQSKAGKPMLKVFLDTAANDSQPGFFSKEFKDDIRPDKKWSHAGTNYILVEDENGNCSKSFKTFMTCYEHSNGCEAIWGDKFADQFKNKKIGAVYGQVENEYNGKVTMRNELRWFCSDDKVDSVSVPEPKYLAKKEESPASDDMGFMDVENTSEDDLPF